MEIFEGAMCYPSTFSICLDTCTRQFAYKDGDGPRVHMQPIMHRAGN